MTINEHKTQKLYWLGNSAKTKVINEILNQENKKEKIIIFDYGCGAGGDWSNILSDYPHLQLVGYEPCRKAFELAQERLKGFQANLFTANELHALNFKADFIVSFSVFEHVYDRYSYLQTAKKHLAEDGIFYLNYDDGHFRNSLDLSQPDLWSSQLKEWLHNLVAEPLARIGMVSQFQKRLPRAEVDRLIDQTGFRIINTFYSNLASFKALHKRIPQEKQKEFSQFWLDVEETLNAKFYEDGLMGLGDTANLWQQMGSRTLSLCHLR